MDFNQAIWNCDVEEVRRLLALGADVNRAAGGRWHISGLPLSLAIQRAEFACSARAKDLRDAGKALFPDSKPHDLEANRKQSIEIINLLIKAGCDLNLIADNRSPLSRAVYWQDLEVVKILLHAGADPAGISLSPISKHTKRTGKKVENGFWNTALHEAAGIGQLNICEALITAGADTNAPDHEGKTAMETAQQNGHSEIATFLEAHLKRKKPSVSI